VGEQFFITSRHRTFYITGNANAVNWNRPFVWGPERTAPPCSKQVFRVTTGEALTAYAPSVRWIGTITIANGRGTRMRFERGDLAGLTDEKTIAQLAAMRYQHNARGQVVIESKDDARKRGVRSPDRAEALMLAFAPVVARHFVILSRGRAREALNWTRSVMTRIGLTLNEVKTSIKQARREQFNFLGYTFGPHHLCAR
jgi:hypothetical protein